MNTSRLKIPTPISGGMILSYKCTASCRHCMYFCSPQWPSDWISPAELEQCLQQLAGKIQPAYGGPDSVGLNEGLHFTGGEPFMNFPLLVRAVEMAAEMGIPSIFVETNCAWCTDDTITRDRLRLLRDRGLKGIMISVNPYYTEFIPFARTLRGVRIGVEVFGSNVLVYQLEFFRLFQQMDLKGCLSFEEFRKDYSGYINPWNVELFLMGRATLALRSLYPSKPARNFYSERCMTPFLRPWHNHFDNYGNFMPGFCGGISLGDWRKLDHLLTEGLDLTNRPVLAFLVKENLAGLHQFASDLGYRDRDIGYISRCDLCLDIRRFLVSKGNFPELQPVEFYNQIQNEFTATKKSWNFEGQKDSRKYLNEN